MRVDLKENSYDIIIGKNILKEEIKIFNDKKNILIVTDSGVPEEYLQILKENINSHIIVYTLEQGEESKNIYNLKNILSFMLRNDFNRKDICIALGGGVVGDITGFASSIYMRGISFYNIPTTLLSMVDSSIGGKTAIDFENVKNVVGTFYQPKKVIIDIDVLKTLSDRQFNNGMVEAIKMALCFDKELFYCIKENIENLRDEKILKTIIEKSLKIKKDVVEKDEKEKDLRKVLNFGHTIGHGIEESVSNKLFHGECVGLGMIAMSSEKVKEEIIFLLNKLNIETKYNFKEEKVFKNLSHDKKASDKGISCIYVEEIGKYKIINKTLEDLKEDIKKVKI